MKKLLILLTLTLLTSCCSGPRYPAGFKAEVQKNNARMRAYMKLKTSQEQDRAMLKANAKAWADLEEVIDGK